MTSFRTIRLITLSLFPVIVWGCSVGATRFDTTEPRIVEQTAAGAWLSIQSSSEQASMNAQQATTAEKELANQRFLDTYKHPIPDYFPTSLGISNSQ